MSRLPEQPGERIDRATVLRFTFDGKPVEAYDGDTIGSALYAAGRRTFSRSFKYHRRRGLLCCAGQCPNCIVAVDGAPGVRACVEPVREGMRVEHLNAKPGLELDVMRATDLVGSKFTLRLEFSSLAYPVLPGKKTPMPPTSCPCLKRGMPPGKVPMPRAWAKGSNPDTSP